MDRFLSTPASISDDTWDILGPEFARHRSHRAQSDRIFAEENAPKRCRRMLAVAPVLKSKDEMVCRARAEACYRAASRHQNPP